MPSDNSPVPSTASHVPTALLPSADAEAVARISALLAAAATGEPALAALRSYEYGGWYRRGGMGTVYKVLDARQQRRPFALKVMLPGRDHDPSATEKCVREIEITKAL